MLSGANTASTSEVNMVTTVILLMESKVQKWSGFLWHEVLIPDFLTILVLVQKLFGVLICPEKQYC